MSKTVGEPVEQLQDADRVRVGLAKNHRTQTRYRRAKETKRGETNLRKSEHLDSTAETGEPEYPEGESAEGSEVSEFWTAFGKHINCLDK